MTFAKRLIQQLIAAINLLASDVGKGSSMITDALKEFSNSMNERCADSGAADLDKQVIRFYKPDAVKAFAKELVLDRVEQQKQTGMVRASLSGVAWRIAEFRQFQYENRQGEIRRGARKHLRANRH